MEPEGKAPDTVSALDHHHHSSLVYHLRVRDLEEPGPLTYFRQRLYLGNLPRNGTLL